MIRVDPVTLAFNGVRLEPLAPHHADGLRAAAADGELWTLRVTSVPAPQETGQYIRTALETSNRCAFAVIDAASGTVIGSTSYHDILPAVDRVEIGYTWYAGSRQRSHVNTSCKLMLLAHAFDTLGCAVVGLRTDNLNLASQAAIERLGAGKDGVIRHSALRRDGSVRDTVMYSILRSEWPAIRTRLHARLNAYGPAC
ncbi:GNAT family N-acetyltransferase [Massilia forsythiae]|uniref:GNAT family N-acetyltransferase n=1 Tax=Massilia forsythiae TaxID=2728020 RepID=A0A7Z2VWJ8_9BURK|nr:GNAT family protein [Massilia forsythiae]QJE00561.1 GNAT family N-acetyltransferase [Massilia forsythiae]